MEHLAVRHGHKCVVKIPPCHDRVKDGKLTSLDNATLDSATNLYSQLYGKTVTSPNTLQHLQRNYQIIQPASQVSLANL